ncbi:VacJ family lipoprotein [Uliginosibacterium sp. sgz301328]|uniref:MlaA family lipoprotein n=1 Tax=Uliginosibacterium sp. sgz301328 TaxID=3243764 RepID=UPI00359D7AF6
MQRLTTFLAAGLLVALTGCATTGSNPRDPFEPFNRDMYNFNSSLDRTFIKPVAEAYVDVTPRPARVNVSNFFGNLADIWIGVNNLLQGKPGDAASDLGRVVVNSTVGILGFFDIASEIGLDKHDEDFGQTLGVWGVGDGPFLVLPLFGPRTTRDAFGLIPDTYAALPGYIDDIPTRNIVRGVGFVSLRADLLGTETTLSEAALDEYSFVRDFYLRRRANLIRDGRRVRDDDAMTTPPVLLAASTGYLTTRRLALVELDRQFATPAAE